MRKNIWIFNHYATAMFYDCGDRHYWFAENLLAKKYNPTIFCASTVHNSVEVIDTGSELFCEKVINDIPFVFVKTSVYEGNSVGRIKNVLIFYKNLIRVAKLYANLKGKPDVILASSGHPLTAVAGIRIAKVLKIPCVVEIRDLQPESAISYGFLKEKSWLAKILYLGEKWIYKKADRLIFTMEGGKKYIEEKKWSKEIDLNKIYHINNGLDINQFDSNAERFELEDVDLSRKNVFKVVYTGSVRRANNLNLLLEAAKYISKKGFSNIEFLIYGEGNERESLEKKCEEENINNVVFKGKIGKKFIPYILVNSDLNILNYTYHSTWKYGGSQRKFFEYLASGKPVLSTVTMGYDLITKFNVGISLCEQTAEAIGEAVIGFSQMDNQRYCEMGENARKLAHEYDFQILTAKLIELMEGL